MSRWIPEQDEPIQWSFDEVIGVGRGTSVLAISVIGVVSIVGRNVADVVSDKFGRIKFAAPWADIAHIVTAAFTMFVTSAILLALTVLFGIGYGGLGAFISQLIADMFNILNAYALFAITEWTWTVLGSAASYLTELGFDVYGTFQPVFIVAGAVGLIAAFVFVPSDEITAPLATDT